MYNYATHVCNIHIIPAFTHHRQCPVAVMDGVAAAADADLHHTVRVKAAVLVGPPERGTM